MLAEADICPASRHGFGICDELALEVEDAPARSCLPRTSPSRLSAGECRCWSELPGVGAATGTSIATASLKLTSASPIWLKPPGFPASTNWRTEDGLTTRACSSSDGTLLLRFTLSLTPLARDRLGSRAALFGPGCMFHRAKRDVGI